MDKKFSEMDLKEAQRKLWGAPRDVPLMKYTKRDAEEKLFDF